MTLSDLAALGSLISGIAVLVSLIFVAVQMRQNTLAVRAAASQAHAANFQQLLNPMIQDGDVARVWRTGFEQLSTLTDDERVRFFLILSGIFRFYEAAHHQWRDGQLDEGHWHQVHSQARDIIRYPGVQTYWKMRRHWHSREFCRWLDALPTGQAAGGLYDLPPEAGGVPSARPDGSMELTASAQ